MRMDNKNIVLAKSAINQRVKELGREITEHYQGKDLVVVGVLKGAFVFMADLIRAIDMDFVIDFLQATSYGRGRVSCGRVEIGKDIEIDIAGKDLLLVEDIVDTGKTLVCLKENLAAGNPNSIRTCVLIDKQERRQQEVSVDYVGFVVKEGFLVGYGLDDDENYRHYPEVFTLG
jgi:hypoxanthine phosphoribosyltransferase